MIKIRFNYDEAVSAFHEWRFNCGPGAICAVLGMTPEEVRPALFDFEKKGYVNPTLMFRILDGLHVDYRPAYRGDLPGQCLYDSPLTLTRIQWGGPWTKPGAPMRARYRQTHWIATTPEQVFDINCMGVGGWVPRIEWTDQVVPWLIREAVPKADGSWWPTHIIEIRRR